MKRFQKKKWILQTGIFLAVLICFQIAVQSVFEKTGQQQKKNLETAARRSAVLCYAMEGRYPESVSYMEEYYGLRYDKERYLIGYEVIGSNLMPDITIIEK